MWPNPQLLIWSHLLKKSLMENFIFCAVGIDCGIARLQLQIPGSCLSGLKIPFIEQNYEKQKGPGTSYQPRFRLQILC